MWFIRALIILLGVIAFLWLGMQNAGETVDFKFFTKSHPGLDLNLLLLLVLATGMVFSFLIATVSELQLRSRLASQRRAIAQLERELAALRNLPLDDAGTAAGEAEG